MAGPLRPIEAATSRYGKATAPRKESQQPSNYEFPEGFEQGHKPFPDLSVTSQLGSRWNNQSDLPKHSYHALRWGTPLPHQHTENLEFPSPTASGGEHYYDDTQSYGTGIGPTAPIMPQLPSGILDEAFIPQQLSRMTREVPPSYPVAFGRMTDPLSIDYSQMQQLDSSGYLPYNPLVSIGVESGDLSVPHSFLSTYSLSAHNPTVHDPLARGPPAPGPPVRGTPIHGPTAHSLPAHNGLSTHSQPSTLDQPSTHTQPQPRGQQSNPTNHIASRIERGLGRYGEHLQGKVAVNARPPKNIAISTIELCIFYPNYFVLPEVIMRVVRNGWTRKDIAKAQLHAINMLTIDNLKKAENRIQKQISDGGKIALGLDENTRWDKEKYSKELTHQNDLTSAQWQLRGQYQQARNSTRKPRQMNFEDVPLADIHSQVYRSRWPTSEDRLLLTVCLEFDRSNPNFKLNTSHFDFILGKLGLTAPLNFDAQHDINALNRFRQLVPDPTV